ncbi:MAG: isoamylase early set domain-containing protein [Chloroflexi bacterium]|nr:isoamylase early set domain-containing protein [Chloroflexota bacterium]
MINKTFVEINGKQMAQVTFRVPDGLWACALYLVGDFNQWHNTSHPFERTKRDGWTITIYLEIGHAYQFRYRCEADHWLNDTHADAYVHNAYGSDNFVVVTDPNFQPHRDPRPKEN